MPMTSLGSAVLAPLQHGPVSALDSLVLAAGGLLFLGFIIKLLLFDRPPARPEREKTPPKV